MQSTRTNARRNKLLSFCLLLWGGEFIVSVHLRGQGGWYAASRVHTYTLESIGVLCMRNTKSGVRSLEYGAWNMEIEYGHGDGIWNIPYVACNSLQSLHASSSLISQPSPSTLDDNTLLFYVLHHHHHPSCTCIPSVPAMRGMKVEKSLVWSHGRFVCLADGGKEGGEDKELMQRPQSRAGNKLSLACAS